MNTEQIQIPARVEEYVRAVIFMEEVTPRYRQQEAERVRGLWQALMADPPQAGGLDWAEIVADWHDDYHHWLDTPTDEVLRGVREVAAGYLEQAEYAECRACGRAAWLGTVGDCSECEGTDDE